MNNKKSRIGIITGFIVYVIIAFYINIPTINIQYTGFLKVLIPFFIGLYLWELKTKTEAKKPKIFLPVIIFGIILILILSNFTFLLLIAIVISFLVEKKRGLLIKKPGPSRFILLGIIVFTSIIPFFTSSPLMNSDKYREIIGEITIINDLDEYYPSVSEDQIRVVDQMMARRLGEKTLGADPSIGSQSELGTFNIQSVNGELYWVAPLLHSGFFKWYENREGTTGYVMVSATDDSDILLVQENGGKPVRIKYQINALFSEDLSRHIYLNGYITTGFEDYTFEIDDDGKPYWVVTTFNKKVGFSGKDATGVLLIDCSSGDIKSYSINDTPSWVDRIQPEDFVTRQLNSWGEYVHGFFNFSDKDKLRTTGGLSLVYGKDGRSFWNTGLTSVGADDGTVGFVLVDTRTKESFWYKLAGATEYAARLSAEGKVQEKRYDATWPVMYNLSGIPTYIMSLTDNGGLVKMYAAVSVADYTTVEVANSISELLGNYKGELYSTDTTINNTVESVIERIASEVSGGDTSYYITLSNIPDKILRARAKISPELSLSRAGDSVELKYIEEDKRIIDLRGFDNLEF